MSLMSDPARGVAAVTPSDSTDIGPARALYVGGAGDVAIIAKGNTAAETLTAVPAGAILPIRVTKVMSTNTTATAIVALY